MSNTTQTIKLMRDNGWYTTKTEYWNSFSRTRNDLFTIIDVLGVKDGKILAVQTTSLSNIGARVKKIKISEAFPFLKAAGWSIQVWGWHQEKPRAKWQVKIIEVS